MYAVPAAANNFIFRKQLPLLQQRPVVYQHGDFHVGNFIYLPTRQVGVIDFNRWDFGDPYEEFYKLQFFKKCFAIVCLWSITRLFCWESSYLIFGSFKSFILFTQDSIL